MLLPSPRPPRHAPARQEKPRILFRIGTGGMAEVFLAAQPSTDQDSSGLIVLKRVWAELAADPDFVAMFRDEAQLCSRLDHPNVVRTRAVGEEDGRPFIAMEYLAGHSLRQVLDRLRGDNGLPVALHAFALTEVLAGLHHAHTLTDGQGALLEVVHRDVSPQNVFVTYDGGVKLMDFGVARSRAAVHQTRPGVVKGRVAYMAPEQARGGAVDRRADLFSVGVMLWEAIAGRRLWEHKSETDILQRLLSGESIAPPPERPGVPEGLGWICARALAFDPDRRYASAAQFRDELLTALGGAPGARARLGQAVAFAFSSDRAAARTQIDDRLRALGGEVSDLSDGTRVTSTVSWVGAGGTLFHQAPARADTRTEGAQERRRRPTPLAWLAVLPVCALVFWLGASAGKTWVSPRPAPVTQAVAAAAPVAETKASVASPPPVQTPPTPAVRPPRAKPRAKASPFQEQLRPLARRAPRSIDIDDPYR